MEMVCIYSIGFERRTDAGAVFMDAVHLPQNHAGGVPVFADIPAGQVRLGELQRRVDRRAFRPVLPQQYFCNGNGNGRAAPYLFYGRIRVCPVAVSRAG